MLTELSKLEVDALTEIFNVGIGYAAASLSEMVGQEVELSIPGVKLLDQVDVSKALCKQYPEDVCGMKEPFSGEFYVDAMLVFSEESSLALVQLLLDQSTPLNMLTEMEQDALTEIWSL